MNLTETTLLLAKVQSNDRRTVGEVDVLTWQEALDDIDAADAMEAVKDHIRNGKGWLTPATVREFVRGIHKRRMQDAGPVDYPSGLSQAQERSYRLVWLDAVKRGLTTGQATAYSDEQTGHARGELVGNPAVARQIETFR